MDELARLLHRSYLYRNLGKTELLDMIHFLDSLNHLRFDEDDQVLTKTRKTREYYYSNLSMIPDERRYPVINILSDRKIGTLGDEFMALHARVGLNFIMKGKVWRIVQIEDEAGTVHVLPSEDPFASVPGWDGEILPVPFELAQQTGHNRERIAEVLKETGDVNVAAEVLAKELGSDKDSMLNAISEVDEQIKQNAPLPTENHVVLEVYDKYLIVHACFGELVNKTLGGVFDRSCPSGKSSRAGGRTATESSSSWRENQTEKKSPSFPKPSSDSATKPWTRRLRSIWKPSFHSATR